MKKFENLSASEKEEIKKAHKEGNLEVHCDWWPKNHWEEKVPDSELWDECYYQIKK